MISKRPAYFISARQLKNKSICLIAFAGSWVSRSSALHNAVELTDEVREELPILAQVLTDSILDVRSIAEPFRGLGFQGVGLWLHNSLNSEDSKAFVLSSGFWQPFAQCFGRHGVPVRCSGLHSEESDKSLLLSFSTCSARLRGLHGVAAR